MSENNIIHELLREDLVKKLLEKKLGKKIKLVCIDPIKKHIWHTTYHVVFRYIVKIEGVEKNIFVTAHDHEPREVALKSLKYLFSNGFGSGNYLVPEPLFYVKKYNATFYIGLEGYNLFHYIKENNHKEIRRLIIKTAEWFAKLHQLSTRNKLIFRENNSKISIVSPGVGAVLSAVNTQYPQYIHDYDKFYRYFIESENRNFAQTKLTMIHGDAHPENVIRIDGEKIGVIDFVDMSVGDRARDLGTFLQQLDYMTGRKIGDEKFVTEIKSSFLTTYLKSAKIEMTDNLAERIKLYYNWTAIRTATFFLMKHNPEPERAEPLICEVRKNLNIK
jgi:aminoglycoside phosphotransferase